jgi:hypothetical protein
MRGWRNWQTHYLEVVAPFGRGGSSPLPRTVKRAQVHYIQALFTLAIFWCAVWGVFIGVFQAHGVDYINHYPFSCMYFAAIITLMVRFEGHRIKAYVKRLSRFDAIALFVTAIASVAIYVAIQTYLMPRALSLHSVAFLATPLHYSLRIEIPFLITKTFEILFQQLFFVLCISYLFENNLSKLSDALAFGGYLFLIHVPLLFVLHGFLAPLLVASSLLGGFIFAVCITSLRDGFTWSYIIHYSFYVFIGLIYWLMMARVI